MTGIGPARGAGIDGGIPAPGSKGILRLLGLGLKCRAAWLSGGESVNDWELPAGELAKAKGPPLEVEPAPPSSGPSASAPPWGVSRLLGCMY